MPPPEDDVGWRHLSTPRRWLVALLLAAPVAAMLAVPLYSRATPALGGVPFFYWSQFAGVPVSMLAMAAALRLLGPRAAGRRRGGGGQQHP